MIKPWMVVVFGYMVLRLFTKIVSSEITKILMECLTAYWIFKGLSFFMSESINNKIKKEEDKESNSCKIGFLRKEREDE